MNLQFMTYNEQFIYRDGLQLVFNHFSNHPHYVFLVFLVFLHYAASLKKRWPSCSQSLFISQLKCNHLSC